MKVINYKDIQYGVPAKWYNGVYKDKKQCCKAARPFSMKHEKPSDECWLLIHGFRGYPGEMIRPAVDLFDAGYDVYVPRLPGCGTSCEDFINSSYKDWIKVAQNSLDELKRKYKKVNLLGHSMGCAISAIIGCKDEQVGKIVYTSPSFDCTLLRPSTRLLLTVISPFIKALKCEWNTDSRFHLHYENAPADDAYLGSEYYSFNCPKQTLYYWKLMQIAKVCIKEDKHKILTVYPLLDDEISKPSVEIIRSSYKEESNIVEIPNGTHLVFYDIDTEAEEKAVKAVLEFAKI